MCLREERCEMSFIQAWAIVLSAVSSRLINQQYTLDRSCVVKSLSCVRLFVTLWTAAYQAPPPMGFSRQEYWSGVPLPSLQRHTTKHNISFLLHLVLQNLNNMRNIYHLFPIRKNCLPEFILFHFILFSIRKWKKKKTIKPCFQVTGKWALSFGPVTVPEMSSDQESNDMRNSRKLVLG